MRKKTYVQADSKKHLIEAALMLNRMTGDEIDVEFSEDTHRYHLIRLDGEDRKTKV